MTQRVIKLITGELIFGEVEAVVTGAGADAITEVQIKTPFSANNQGIFPYLIQSMGSAPAAIQIHPMNILWQLPLDEFPIVEKAYNEAISKIIKPSSNIIL